MSFGRTSKVSSFKEEVKVFRVHVFHLMHPLFSSFNVSYGHKESQSTFDFGKVKV